MTNSEVIALFKRCGALLEGHFPYASGRHGRHFLQAARVMQHPQHVTALCAAMIEPFRGEGVTLVIGPATGGITLAFEAGRQLGCRAAYTEKAAEGAMALKRGFALYPDDRVLVVEDIITTGGSVQKSIDHLAQRGASVIGVASIIDRGGTAQFACEYRPLATFQLESWAPRECPLCLEKRPMTEPDEIIVA